MGNRIFKITQEGREFFLVSFETNTYEQKTYKTKDNSQEKSSNLLYPTDIGIIPKNQM